VTEVINRFGVTVKKLALLGEANRGSRGEKRLGGKPLSTDVQQERTYCADPDEASQQRSTGIGDRFESFRFGDTEITCV
jgi:hypothetical protein